MVDAGTLGNEQLVVTSYPSLDAWPGGSSAAGNGAAGAGDDCLVLAARVDELTRGEVIERLADSQPGLPIVVLSPSPTVPDTALAVRQGAYSIADVATDPATLSSMLRSAADEGRKSAGKRKHLTSLRTKLETLTNAERQVLDAMLDGKANKQIAQALEIGLRTVELRRSKIMRKMNARSLAELIKFVCQVLPHETAEPPVEPSSQPLGSIA
ncbi:MAG: LuxR C-terminal-related transcriptional regulator [Planctomycetota bacterium]